MVFYTTEFWTTSSSWYNSTSSFTTSEPPPREAEPELEGTTFSLPKFSTSFTTPFTEGTYGPNNDEDNAHLIDNSNEGAINVGTIIEGMELSKFLFGPFCLILLVTSGVLLYLVLRHFRHLIHLYFSLVFYSLTQIFLFSILATTAILQTFLKLEEHCDVVNTVEFVALTLPGYGILLVTLARWLCVAYPTQYKRYLDLRLQTLVVVLLVGILVLVTCLPVFGVCSNVWVEQKNVKMGGYCHVQSDGSGCRVFRWLLVSVGFVMPFVGVLLLYCLIVILLIQHKRKSSKYNPTEKKSGQVDYNYQPVTIGEKLSHLKAIGQDAIPWSIIVILALNTCATLLWIPHIFSPERYFQKALSDYIAMDLMYVVMLAAVSFSPAAYFLTTPVMRAQLFGSCCRKGSQQKLSMMSKNTESTADV